MLDDALRLRVLAEIDAAGRDAAAAPLRAAAQLAAWICGTPMAAVSLLGLDEQVFVGSVGLDVDRTDRASSFCDVAMRTPQQPLVVPDTHADARFADNRLVLGDPHIRSYVGVPLLLADDVPVGAVCALGDQPQQVSPGQLEALRALAGMTEAVLQSQRTSSRLQSTLERLTAAERAEAVSQEQFRTVFDLATVGMTVVDDRGVYVRVNAAFAGMLGYRSDELVGRHFSDITDSDDQVDVGAIRELLTGESRTALREKRYRHRDGTPVPALVSSCLIRFGDADAWLLLNHVESLAERRAAEARLLELHSAVDGIISLDHRGRVVAWNLGAERLLGHPAARMLGQPLDAIIPAELHQAHDDGVARASAGAAPRLVGRTVEVPAVHADGHELMVELSLSTWAHDGMPHYTAILRDITERRNAQVQADLVRRAAATANDADTFSTAAETVVRDVCTTLGWLAGHAWTTTAEPATWFVGEHPHTGGCPLAGLAGAGAAPDAGLLPLDARTRIATGPEDLPGLGPAATACGIGAAVAVPIFTGGEVGGMMALYLPAGAAAPQPSLVTALEQIGMTLGRVVERQRTAATLLHGATHDPVTELANRRRLLDEIGVTQRRLADGPEPGRRSAALLVNLDRFRVINDALGYAAGDQVLCEAAERIRRATSPADLVARLSADEFVVLAHRDTGGTDDTRPFTDLAQRLLQALHDPIDVVGHRVNLRASIGVCPVTAGHAAAAHYPAAVLRDADAALRHAKRRGRDQIQVVDAALRSTTRARLADETALAEAIAGEQLLLHYQPITDLGTGRPVGVEALVRWDRPGHGMVAPDQFIGLAEESGLIIDLGRWVLRQACRDAAAWLVTVPALADATVGVNVSTRQLTHPRFLRDLDAALTESGLPPQRLIVEITETAVIEDHDATLTTLHAIRARGVQLALDDFGTGYSSLSYVQNLPVNILKIDKSFVDPITGPGHGTALSEVVLKLAEAIGLRTVAEGVESPHQADALRALGCDRGQGYLWSRPVPVDQLPTVTAAISRHAAVPLS